MSQRVISGGTWMRRNGSSGLSAANPYADGLTPLLWWDSSDAATMFLERTGASATTPSTSTGLVGSWKSKGSLSDIWAIANADGERPSRNQGYSVVFSAGKGLDAVIPTIPQPHTVIILGLTTTASGGYAIEGQSGTVAWGLIPTNRSTFYAGTDLAIASYVVGTTYTQAASLYGALSRVRRNNSSWTSGNAGTASLATPMRFNMNGAGDKPWATQISQRMIFDGILSDEKIKYWENQCRVLSGFNLSPSDVFSGATLDAMWTSNNQANMSLLMGNGYLLWTQSTGVSTDSLAYITTPISGSAWSIDLKITNLTINNYVTNTNWPGFLFKNSSTGKTYLFSLNRTATNAYVCYGARFNGDTYSSTPITATGISATLPSEFFYRATLASGVITFYTSLDGITWTSRGTETVSTHLGSVDMAGIWSQANNPNTTSTARVQSFLRILGA